MAESKLEKEKLKNLRLRNQILKLRRDKLEVEISQIEDVAENYYIDKAIEVAKVLPWKEILLSGVLIYAWKEAGENKNLNAADVILGIVGGFTLEDALRGGIVANGYAVGYLSSLGLTAAGISGLLQDIADKPELIAKSLTKPPPTSPGGIGQVGGIGIGIGKQKLPTNP